MKSNATNANMQQLIIDLKHLSIAQKVKIWRAVALSLSKSNRVRAEVSITKLESSVRDGEIAIVPGKVLGTGDLSRKITVAAWSFSDRAKEKINKSGKAVSIQELMKQNPKGSKVRIIA